MIQINEKRLCCGCSACSSVCPKHCIEMKPDNEGFAYPSVDMDQCVNCGLCEKVCPIRGEKPSAASIDAYIVQDKRNEIRETSSSGGAFTGIAEYILNQGGTVYGAAFDGDYHVHHVGVNNIEALSAFRGSKYVQSDPENVFCEIRKRLKNCEWVLFSGTPCQVAGLKSFLQYDYERLVTVDIACHGVPSPKLWHKYLSWWCNKQGSLTNVEFRSKVYGYSGSTMKLTFADGFEVSTGAMLQHHKNTMFAGLSLRPSCYGCHFKTANRTSDFTLFDCWDVNLFNSEMDDDKGTTVLLVQSEKGKRLFGALSNTWKFHKVDPEVVIRNDGDMILASAKKNPRRCEFFNDLDIMDLKALDKKYFPKTLKTILVQVMKPILYKMNMLNKLKRSLK